MFHDIVKAWAVRIQLGRLNKTSGRRASRRFSPQLGEGTLEGRLVLSTYYMTPTVDTITTTTAPTMIVVAPGPGVGTTAYPSSKEPSMIAV